MVGAGLTGMSTMAQCSLSVVTSIAWYAVPAGAMMALLLAQRGVNVRVVELRYDSRVKAGDSKSPGSAWKNTVIEKTVPSILE